MKTSTEPTLIRRVLNQKTWASPVLIFTIVGLLSLNSVASADPSVYTYETYAAKGFISGDHEKETCEQAAHEAYDKGIKICQGLNGILQSVGPHRLDIQGPICTVFISFNCTIDLHVP